MKEKANMKVLRLLSPPCLAAALCAAAVLQLPAENPMAHVDIKTVQSYTGTAPLPKPDRIVIYDFTVAPDIVKTDPRPGLRGRVSSMGSSESAAEKAARKVQSDISSNLLKSLEKSAKSSGIPVEMGTAGTPPEGNALVIEGSITSLNEGKHLQRETVGLGAGASDVATDCNISMHTPTGKVLVSELTTNAASGKKPGAAVTMGAGAAPDVAAATSGATSHKSTAAGDAARTGSALAKNIAKMMKAQGWITADQTATAPAAQ